MVDLDWNLIFIGLGALFAALLVIVETYQAYNKYIVPKKEEKRASIKIELMGKLGNYRYSRSGLERSLKDYVMTNKFTEGFHVYTRDLSSDFEERIEEWNGIYARCVDWKVASELVITIRLQELTREYLPTTCKHHADLLISLNSDDFKQRYFEGKEVAKRWIEKNYPKFYERIMKHLKEKESKLDLFFLRLNETFQKDQVLTRFRKEKNELIELGQTILADLKLEEEKLRRELELYKDIEIVEEGIPLMT